MLKTALFYYLLRTKIQCVSYFYIYKKVQKYSDTKSCEFFCQVYNIYSGKNVKIIKSIKIRHNRGRVLFWQLGLCAESVVV